MKTSKLLMLLAALYAGQAIAADTATSPDVEKAVPTAKQKVIKHKKDCVEKDGKPCHLHAKIHAQQAVPAGAELKPASAEPKALTTEKAVQGLAPATAPAAAAAAVVKPEVAPAVSAADALALAKKNNCLVCHAVDKKVVGPAWKEVAAKYRGDAKAEAYLVSKIAKGGSGAWGSMPMPANTQVSDADRRTLARFVLNLQ